MNNGNWKIVCWSVERGKGEQVESQDRTETKKRERETNDNT